MNEIYRNLHQDLIDRCRKGDTQAQFQLYKLYYKAMYNTCVRMVKNQQEAEDIMQESFLAVFRHMDTYKGEVSFGAWIKRIVINRCLDHLKKKKIDLCPIEEKLFKLESPTERDFHHSSKGEMIEKIKKAMVKLPHGYRIILSLYLLEGYDHQEIAQIMEITSSTSRSQYTRAKKKLLELLKKDGEWQHLNDNE